MHKDLFNIFLNTFLLLLLIAILILPISTVTIMNLNTSKSVLSAQDDRPEIQLPRHEIIRRNAERIAPDGNNRDYRPAPQVNEEITDEEEDEMENETLELEGPSSTAN